LSNRSLDPTSGANDIDLSTVIAATKGKTNRSLVIEEIERQRAGLER